MIKIYFYAKIVLLTLLTTGGGWISPPLRIIVMTSWNNDDESLIITYFSYFGLRNISQLVLSVFVKWLNFYSRLKSWSRIFYLVNFCWPAIFLVWLQIFKLLSFCCFSSKGYDFWYLGLTWEKVQEYLVKFYFLVKECNPHVRFLPSNTP